jgi:tetratricopeptide (TPR) repeat protein
VLVRSRRWLGLCVCLLALLACSTASAQRSPAASEPAGAAEPERYRRLIGDALAAYEEGRFVTALSLFEEAHALWPNARAMRGVALVLFELGDHVKTLHALDKALASPVDPLPPELRDQLLEVRNRAAQRVERVVVQVAPAGAALRVDGRDVELTPAGELWLAPGVHRIEVSQPGFTADLRVLTSVPGDARTLLIKLLPAPVASEAQAVEQRRSRLGWGSAVAVGLSAAGVAVWRSIALSSALARCEAGEGEGATCHDKSKASAVRATAIGGAIVAMSFTIMASIPLVRSLKSRKERAVKTVSSWSCAMSRSSLGCEGVVRW